MSVVFLPCLQKVDIVPATFKTLSWLHPKSGWPWCPDSANYFHCFAILDLWKNFKHFEKKNWFLERQNSDLWNVLRRVKVVILKSRGKIWAPLPCISYLTGCAYCACAADTALKLKFCLADGANVSIQNLEWVSRSMGGQLLSENQIIQKSTKLVHSVSCYLVCQTKSLSKSLSSPKHASKEERVDAVVVETPCYLVKAWLTDFFFETRYGFIPADK